MTKKPPQELQPENLMQFLQGASEIFTKYNQVMTKLILDPAASTTLSMVKLNAPEVRLAIGPEGGFSDPEVQQAIRNGFVGVTLGPRVLRTESAAIASLAAVQALWGDLA